MPKKPYECIYELLRRRDVVFEVILDGSTHPCLVEQCGGGVGRNMAEALWRMRGGRVLLLTAVGDDADGHCIRDIAPGLLLDGCVVKGGRTATYAAILDAKGECRMGLGNMELHSHITVDAVNRNIDVLKQAPLVIIDGNIPQDTIEHILQLCNEMQKPVFFEPTDRRMAIKPLMSKHSLTFASPNLAELRAMATYLEPNVKINKYIENDERMIMQLCEIVSQRVHYLIITIGSKGVITVRNFLDHPVQARHYPVETLQKIVNVSGAGDCFASGFISGMLLGHKESLCTAFGFGAAKIALMSKNTVPENISLDDLNKEVMYTKLDINSI